MADVMRQEQIAMVCSILSVDASRAQSALEAHNWNVEDTINTLLTAEPQNVPVNQARPARPAQPPRMAQNDLVNIPLATEAKREEPTEMEEPTRSNAFEFISRIPVAGNVFGAVASILSPPNSKQHLDQQAIEFVEKFEREHDYVPVIVHGSDRDAVAAARQAGRLVFVYIHCDEHDDAHKFVRETLCTESMANFLTENYVTWVGNTRHSYAYSLARKLGYQSFPFFAVLLPERQNVISVYTHNGMMDADALIATLFRIMEAHQNIMQREASRNSVHQEARSLRQQQDREYAEALAMQAEKKQQEEEEKQRIAEAEARAEQARLEAEEERKRQEALLQQKQQEIEQKRSEFAEEPADGPNISTVQIRLPDGNKITRRFHDTTTIRTIMDWVNTHELVSKVDDHVIASDRFNLATSFPQRVFDDHSVTLKSIGRRCAFFVQEIGNGSESESSSDEESDDDDAAEQ